MRHSKSQLAFTLAVLFGINTMNFYDRQVLPAVQESIREAWDLKDSQLGWLGTSFILLYALVGLPLGRLADTWNRRWLLAIGVAIWSVFTFVSGYAWGFWSLFLFRLGVGVGEASCAPTASSLIGDLFPADKRARAMSIFMLGLPVGLALSFLVSAAVAQRFGWQRAFFVAGVPGFLLAIAALFITDPPRPQLHRANPEFFSAVRQVLAPVTMWWIIASGAIHNFNLYALGTFLASFLRRFHGISLEQAGQISALVYGVGALSIFVSGWLGDLAYQRTVAGRLHVAWIAALISVPCLVLALTAPAGAITTCSIWLLAACLMLYAYYGTIYAVIQDVTAPELRGMAMAVYFCAMYFLGAVLGPVAMGWLSDYFAQRAAEGDPIEPIHRAIGLRDATFIVPALNVVLALVLFAASRTVKKDVLRLKVDQL